MIEDIEKLKNRLEMLNNEAESVKKQIAKLEAKLKPTPEQVAESVKGLHTDKGFDVLLQNDLVWRIVKMNGHDVGRPEDVRADRVLVALHEEVIVDAQLG